MNQKEGVLGMVDAMIVKARAALEKVKDYNQEQTDEMVKVCAKVIHDHAEELAVEAVEETQFGTVESKIGKNKGFSAGLWLQLKGKKSVGILSQDEEPGIVKVAHPVGVVGAITPVTVPNIAPMGNSLLALKGRNAIIVAPSPKSKKSSKHTVDLMRAELVKISAPADLIQIVEEPTLELSQEVMRKCDVVVATGGPGLVKAAYSSGKPAFGVGAGNTQLIVDAVTDFQQFAKETVASRFYDNGTACV
jgi:succinate-semialdehyde dehydrogenase